MRSKAANFLGILGFLSRWVWASPWTIVGLGIGGIGLLTGGHVQRKGRVLEFWGGTVSWFLERAPFVEGGAIAMTLGHVVLGQSLIGLEWSRNHERVHVRQYERWGPAFIPAYLLSSAWQWYRGRDPYRDNYFEREAFERENDCGA
ncbi:MAG: hypothetical protein U1D30_07790 [Planctomycetota bacterium]